MPYHLQRSRKDPDVLTPEEQDVAQALRVYKTLDQGADVNDFVPTFVLYRVYRDYVARFTHPSEQVGTLTIRQFGAALVRVIPHLEEADWDGKKWKPVYKAQRQYHGRKCWGYCGLKGPDSLRTLDEVGRPSNAKRIALSETD